MAKKAHNDPRKTIEKLVIKMNRVIIETDQSPLPFGAYSQAVRSGNLLFVSGQLPIKPGDEVVVSDDPELQLRQCFENIKQICLASKISLNDAVKINVYYTDNSVSELLNKVMCELFTSPYPARIKVKVAGLSRDAKVEIDGVFSCQI